MCKSQLVELARQAEGFRSRGYGVAAVVHDQRSVLAEFAGRYGIGYPLLDDAQAAVARRFGLVNPEFNGTPREGVPYPGTYVVDAAGIIRSRFFERSYRERQTPASVLVRELGAGRGQELTTDHFTLRTLASDQEVVPASRFTLVLDFDVDEGHHLYAPGAGRYTALSLKIEPSPLLKEHETVLPSPVPYVFKPLRETVPVFKGRFRLLKDVSIVDEQARRQLNETPQGLAFDVSARLDYQVCSDRVCFPPASLSLRWPLRLRRTWLPQ